MRRNGYVLLTSLITISIILVLAISIIKIGVNRVNSLKNIENQVQADYIPESIVNIIFGEHIDELEKFYENNYSSLESPMTLPFDFSKYYDADITATIQSDPAFNYNKFLIRITSKYKGITTRCVAGGHDINDIYLKKEGISLEDSENLSIFKFYEPRVLTKIHLKNENEIFLDKDEIVIKDVETNKIVERFPSYIFVAIINDGRLVFRDSIFIKGMFINNGEIDNEFDFTVRGILIDFSKKSQNIIVKGTAAYYVKPKKLIYNFNFLKDIRYDLPKYFNFKLDKITTSDIVN